MTSRSCASNGARQLTPIGAAPSAAELLVCTLLYSGCPLVLQIAECVDADTDFDAPARSAYRAVVALARNNVPPAPELVLDELRRTGRLDRRTACWLTAAATAGAPPESARRYAAVVVAASVRRQTNSWGTTLVELAATAAEDELQLCIDRLTRTLDATFARLAVLRGDPR